MATKDIKAQLLADHAAKIEEFNKICAKGTAAEVDAKLAELANIEEEYKKVQENGVFASLNSTHEAIELHHFTTISHKKVMSEGVMTGIERSDKTVQLDLRKFCEKKGFDLGWFYELQALNKRLTLKVATNIGVKPDEMRRINDSYAMDKLARDIELGKTPTSDNQCIKHMQKVLDMLSPDEGRVNGHDLGYVMACYTKRNNKASLRVQCSKHTMLLSLMADVFHRVVTGGFYGVDYRQTRAALTEGANKDKEGSAPKAEPKPAKAKKAKTGSTTKAKTKTAAVPEDAETVVVPKEAVAA